LARCWYVIIGGGTGYGKTLVALNMVDRALRVGEKVCIVSLEMDAEDLYTRLDSIDSGYPVVVLEQGAAFDPMLAEKARMTRIRETAKSGGALWVNEDPLDTLDEIDAAIRYHVQVRGCRYFVIDYLQLAWVQEAKNLLGQVTEVSHRVRKLTRALGIVTVAISQLNRETSKDMENPPTPQALFGGSPLENDANQVMLLDHTQYETHPDGSGADTRLILGKNRHGPRGKLDVVWDFRSLRIREKDHRYFADTVPDLKSQGAS
jgi:replicative DNA helicase